MRVLTISVTERGRALGQKLPFEHVQGGAKDALHARWDDTDAFVLMLATGASVRLIAPLLGSKRTDPAIVCVDEAGHHCVALCGGHAPGGANTLAKRVASLIGAEPVITTATDASGTPGLETIPGWSASGDVAGVTAALLSGRRPRVDNPLGWPLPCSLEEGAGPERVVVTDTLREPEPGVACLHPPSLVLGVGTSTDAPDDEVSQLVAAALASRCLSAMSVAEVATIDRRASHEAVVALGHPVRGLSAEVLALARVPSPSEAVLAAVGTPSVAEAAALVAAGPASELVVAKRTSAHATVAVARRRQPRGGIAVVGLGPGGAEHRTPAAERAIRNAEVVIGYRAYLDQCSDLLTSTQEVVAYPIGTEVARARSALSYAEGGRRVAVVCSGDPGVYAMASVVFEAKGDGCPELNVEVVPGVTAALSASAALGAPLGHDHAAISLSDLLTPWAAIEARLRAATEADMVVALYNPRSNRRHWQLDAARKVLLERRSPSTPVGVVTDAGRESEECKVTTLADLDTDSVGMATCVIVGSSTTQARGGRLFTPRGYEL